MAQIWTLLNSNANLSLSVDLTTASYFKIGSNGDKPCYQLNEAGDIK